MTFPPGVTLCIVHIPEPIDHNGETAKVRVLVEPSHMLVHQESGTALVKIDRDVTASEAGDLMLSLPHTDQPGFVDQRGNAVTGWSYKLQIMFQGSASKSQMIVKQFQLPAGVNLMNPLLINDGPPIAAIISPVPTVTSIGGLTGVVSAEQIAVLVPPGTTVTPDPANPGFYLIGA